MMDKGTTYALMFLGTAVGLLVGVYLSNRIKQMPAKIAPSPSTAVIHALSSQAPRDPRAGGQGGPLNPEMLVTEPSDPKGGHGGPLSPGDLVTVSVGIGSGGPSGTFLPSGVRPARTDSDRLESIEHELKNLNTNLEKLLEREK